MLNSMRMIIMVLVVGLVVGNGFGSTVEIPALVLGGSGGGETPIPSPGGGGPGEPLPIEINYPKQMSQSIGIPGLELRAEVDNYGDRTSASLWGMVDGEYLRFEEIRMNFEKDDDSPWFSFHASFQFEIFPDTTPFEEINESQHLGLNGLGISMHSSSYVQNYEEWMWEEISPNEWEGYSVMTEDYQLSYHFDLEPFDGFEAVAITSMDLPIREFNYSWDERNILEIGFSGKGYCHNPEPATIGLLGLGSIGLLRRRNSKRIL